MRKLLIGLLITVGMLALCSCQEAGEDPLHQAYRDFFQNTLAAPEEGLELAKAAGAVVMDSRGCIAGKENWEAFFKTVSAGKPDTVLIAHYLEADKEHWDAAYYEQVKDQYPQLSFTLLEYDGKEFVMKPRKSAAEPSGREDTYPYLQHFTGEGLSQSLYTSYSFYVLVDDPTLTWDDLMAASALPPDEAPRDYPIIMEYFGWKE